MRQTCCVFGCRLGHEDGVSLHGFPRSSDFVVIHEGSERRKCNRRKLWEIKLKMGKNIPKRAQVCSNHFQPYDFFPINLDRDAEAPKRVRLKMTAVPSKNLPKAIFHRRIRRSPRKRVASQPCHIACQSSRVINNRKEANSYKKVVCDSPDENNENIPLLTLVKAAEYLEAVEAVAESNGQETAAGKLEAGHQLFASNINRTRIVNDTPQPAGISRSASNYDDEPRRTKYIILGH